MTSDTYFIPPTAKSSINNPEHVSQYYGFLSWGLKPYLLIIMKEGKAFLSAVGTERRNIYRHKRGNIQGDCAGNQCFSIIHIHAPFS